MLQGDIFLFFKNDIRCVTLKASYVCTTLLYVSVTPLEDYANDGNHDQGFYLTPRYAVIPYIYPPIIPKQISLEENCDKDAKTLDWKYNGTRNTIHITRTSLNS